METALPSATTGFKFQQCGGCGSNPTVHPGALIFCPRNTDLTELCMIHKRKKKTFRNVTLSYYPAKPRPGQNRCSFPPALNRIHQFCLLLLHAHFDLMLLKFLPRERCLMDRFLANHTSRVDRSESRPERTEGKKILKLAVSLILVVACRGIK